MAESVDKLKEDLGKLVHSLKLSAFSGVREQAQNLIRKDLLSFGVFLNLKRNESFCWEFGRHVPISIVRRVELACFQARKTEFFLNTHCLCAQNTEGEPCRASVNTETDESGPQCGYSIGLGKSNGSEKL